jgi:eukaryotic-like serine/threonine-protein kinase
MSDPRSPDSAVGSVVESFLERFRKGERPALSELVAGHPDLADQLLEIIPALVELEQLGGPAGSYSGSRADGVVAPEAGHPESLGEYKILRRIGVGGMGVVYEAEHQSLKSRVALKVMHPQFRADAKYLRRFHVEARSAAGLHHTNIVSVFDYGEQAGVCYYAMQYIRGQPLDLVLADLRRLRSSGRGPGAAEELASTRDQRSAARGLMTGRFAAGSAAVAIAATGPIETTLLIPRRAAEDSNGEGSGGPGEPPSFASTSLGGPVEGRYYRQIARVCAQAADALDYAHRAGVLHRDIKPSNLLLDALGNIWVTDFGLAKLEGGEDISRSQDLVGTLRYMAPERFRGVSGRGGDIYALGATLYELATLRPAFEGTDQVRLIDRIVHEPPERPRAIDRRVPRDLETIVLKALAKDPSDRFGSARELAEELRKFVVGHPIRSRPITSAERFYRWCRRNPWLAAANISAAALTTALAISSTIAAKVYHDGQERYAASEVRGRERLFEALASQARASRFSRQVGQRFGSLEAISEAVKIGRELGMPAARFDRLRDEAIASLMLPDMKPAGPTAKLPQGMKRWDVSGGMTRYAFIDRDGTIVVRSLGDDREVARFDDKDGGELGAFGFSPDGRFLAVQHDDTLSVRDVDLKTLACSIPGVHAFSFRPDSRRVAATVKGGAVLVRDLVTGQTRRWEGLEDALVPVYRPDGAEIAFTFKGRPTTCRILDAETGRQLHAIPIPHGEAFAWSPDGSTLAFLQESEGKVLLFHAARGERGATIELPPFSGGTNIGFLPAGTLLATDSWDERLRLWDPASGRERLAMTGGDRLIFDREGRFLVRHGLEVGPWRVDPAAEYVTLKYASNRNLNYARTSIHRDGRLVSVGTDHGVILWDLARKAELGFLPIGMAWHSAFEPSGDLITNGDTGLLRWPVRVAPTGGEVRIGPPRIVSPRGSDCAIAFDRTGRIVAAAGHSYASVVMDGRTIHLTDQPDCRGVSLSPDARWLATTYHGSSPARFWSLPDGTPAFTFEEGVDAKFSPDGRWLVSSTTHSNSSRIWEVGSWRQVRQIEGDFQAFSPDGRLGIFRDMNYAFAIVEIATGRALARFEAPDQHRFDWFLFSPDGSRLVATTKEPPSTVVVDLRLIRRGLDDLKLDWDAPAFPEFDPARPDLPPLALAPVDYGHLSGHLEHFSEDAAALADRYTGRIQRNPEDVDAYHHRAHALSKLNRPAEALKDLSKAISLTPSDAHLLDVRARLLYFGFRKTEPAIADLEAALKLDPSRSTTREFLAERCNEYAWTLVRKSPSAADLGRALALSLRAVELAPGQQESLNTRGVALYRARQFAEAVTILEESLKAGKGQFDAFDLYFLAMSHHRLGHREEARRCLDLAKAWVSRQGSLSDQYIRELADFRREAEAVLTGPVGELPDDVFQRP